jgi:multiple sugar transport system ATP-binding protein
MVYVTHDQIEAMTMADRIVVLNNGRVEQFGTPMELYHHPATKFVASFIGQPNMNFLSAKITGADSDGLSVQTKDGLQLQLPVETGSASIGQNVEIGIRPENITQGSEGLNLNVSVVERLGGTSITYGATDAGIRLCAALDGVANVREGETVELAFDPKDCHVFDAFGTVMRRLMAPDLAD